MILAASIHFVKVKTSTSTDLHESELDSKFQWIDINSLRFAGFPIFMGQAGRASQVPQPNRFSSEAGQGLFFCGAAHFPAGRGAHSWTSDYLLLFLFDKA